MAELDAWQAADPGRRTYCVVVGPLPNGYRCRVQLNARPVADTPARAVSGMGQSRDEAAAKALRLWEEAYGKDW